jgi:hypothetical protein
LRRLVSYWLVAAFVLMMAPSNAAGPVPLALASFNVPGATSASQKLIDEGVAMLYGFNGGQARAKFFAVTQAQPELALSYALMAETYTIDINLPWTAETEQPGRESVAKAVDAAAKTPPTDDVAALIAALAKRFDPASSSDPHAACMTELREFAKALETYVKPRRDGGVAVDPNVLVIDGYALYGWDNSVDAATWNQPVCPRPSTSPAALRGQEASGLAAAMTPSGGAECGGDTVKAAHLADVRKDIRLAVAAQPWNLGAAHLSIHENEYASAIGPAHYDDWKVAIPAAHELASHANQYPPGLSHLSHMTGHIWTRQGTYDKTISFNTFALANDHRYYAMAGHDMNDDVAQGQKYLNRYHTHDMDFVLYALTTMGLDAQARAFVAHEYPDGRPTLSVQLRLHGAVDTPHPPDGNIREPWRTQLGALAAARNHDGAYALELARQLKADFGDATLLELVQAQLAPKYSAAAEKHYAAAYRCNKNAYTGDPKDYWMVPIGEGYGAVLLAHGKFASARDVFDHERGRFPFDPRLEWGLARAYAGMHQPALAAKWYAASKTHWKGLRPLTLHDLG